MWKPCWTWMAQGLCRHFLPDVSFCTEIVIWLLLDIWMKHRQKSTVLTKKEVSYRLLIFRKSILFMQTNWNLKKMLVRSSFLGKIKKQFFGENQKTVTKTRFVEFSFLKSGYFNGLAKILVFGGEQSFLNRDLSVKFMFSKKATKMDEIFTVDLRVITYLLSNCRWRSCQFCGLLKKRKPCLPFYQIIWMKISHDNNYVHCRLDTAV